MARQKHEELAKLFGRNAALAREIAGMTQGEVMTKIWHDDRRRNRISEIENGTSFSVDVLYQLSRLYGVSADFILGLSADPESDHHAARAGMVFNGVVDIASDAVMRMAASLSTATAQYVAHMPKPHSMSLLDAAKRLLSAQDDTANARAKFNLQCCVRDFEKALSLQMRNFEMALQDCIGRPEKKHGLACDVSIKKRTKDQIEELKKDMKTRKKIKAADPQMSLFVAQEVCLALPMGCE